MSDHDRNSEPEQERVVVRDRRRIDPHTGQVRVPSPGESSPASPASEPLKVHPLADTEEVEMLTAQVEERTADLQRITAEYANYRRRVDRDREAVLTTARAHFVGELFTVLDDLDRAEAHGDLTGAFKAVADKIVTVVGKLGLESYGDPGEPFDPALHEAVQHEESDVAGPTVTVVSAVLRRGYRLADRVLRPAMVTVADRAASEVEDVEPAPADPAGDAPADPSRPGPK